MHSGPEVTWPMHQIRYFFLFWLNRVKKKKSHAVNRKLHSIDRAKAFLVFCSLDTVFSEYCLIRTRTTWLRSSHFPVSIISHLALLACAALLEIICTPAWSFGHLAIWPDWEPWSPVISVCVILVKRLQWGLSAWASERLSYPEC